MKQQLTTLALTSLLAISGCATSGGARDYSDSLYLRGQFAWWDALPEYKVKTVEPGVYRTEVELKADGQPYEFKFGDANWSSGSNCGYLSEKEDDIHQSHSIDAAEKLHQSKSRKGGQQRDLPKNGKMT